MKINTTKFVNNLKELISKDKTRQALKIINDSIPKNSSVYNQVVMLKSRFERVNRREILGIGFEENRKSEIAYHFLEFLDDLKSENPKMLEVKRTYYIKNNFNEPITTKRKIKKNKISPGKKKVIAIIFFSILFIFFVKYMIPSNNINESKDETILANKYENKNNFFFKRQKKNLEKYKLLKEKDDGFGIFLDSYETYEEAYLQEKKFPNREVSIFREIDSKDKPFIVVIFPYKNKEFAERKLSDNIKNEWKNSNVFKINDLCSNLKLNKKINCIDCFR